MSNASSNADKPISLWNESVPDFDATIDQPPPALVPYIIEGNRPYGAVIICPGGGYSGRAAHEGEPIARWLNSAGISAFVLEYRVAPYRHPVPLQDAQRAIRTVRARAAEWNIDPDHIGILGFSAGGHLAATAGLHFTDGNPNADDPIERVSCRPDAMILCYAVLSFCEHGHSGSMQNLLGEAPTEELRLLLSHERNVHDNVPPTFLWHTADDGSVPIDNSLFMASALRAKAIPFELHVFPSGSHGLGLAEDHPPVNTWPTLCADWLKRLGF